MLRAKLNKIDAKLDFLISDGFKLSGEDVDALVNARDGLGHIIFALSLDAELFEVLPAASFVCRRIHERCGESSYSSELLPMTGELIRMIDDYEFREPTI